MLKINYTSLNRGDFNPKNYTLKKQWEYFIDYVVNDLTEVGFQKVYKDCRPYYISFHYDTYNFFILTDDEDVNAHHMLKLQINQTKEQMRKVIREKLLMLPFIKFIGDDEI